MQTASITASHIHACGRYVCERGVRGGKVQRVVLWSLLAGISETQDAPHVSALINARATVPWLVAVMVGRRFRSTGRLGRCTMATHMHLLHGSFSCHLWSTSTPHIQVRPREHDAAVASRQFNHSGTTACAPRMAPLLCATKPFLGGDAASTTRTWKSPSQNRLQPPLPHPPHPTFFLSCLTEWRRTRGAARRRRALWDDHAHKPHSHAAVARPEWHPTLLWSERC